MGDGVRVLCTMESASYFHKRVEEALGCNERYPMEVYVANLRLTKSFARVLLKDSKTDRIDSAVLAQYGACMHLRAQAPVSAAFEQLREATRSRRRYVEERTEYINRLRRLLGYYYPGYEQVAGTRLLPKALLVVLSRYPTPQDIVEAGVERLAKLRSGSRHRVGQPRAS